VAEVDAGDAGAEGVGAGHAERAASYGLLAGALLAPPPTRAAEMAAAEVARAGGSSLRVEEARALPLAVLAPEHASPFFARALLHTLRAAREERAL